MTLDGDCDHRSGIADDEIHQHYKELLHNSGVLLYGRITYQLMEDYWPLVVKNPTGNKATDEFGVIIDEIPKMVFSHTLKNVEWESAKLVKNSLEEEVSALRQQTGKDILVGSRSLIITLLNLNLIDEFQLSVQPIISGKGLPLFENIHDRIMLELIKTKTFSSGIITFYYKPVKK